MHCDRVHSDAIRIISGGFKMIQTITEAQFRQAFHDYGREEQFSHEALGLIFNWFEQFEQDTGEPYDLDVIAICCDISESTPEEVQRQYSVAHDCDDEGDLSRCVIQDLDDHTSIIGETTKGKIVFFNF